MNIVNINPIEYNKKFVTYDKQNQKKMTNNISQSANKMLSYPSSYYMNFTGETRMKTIGELYNDRNNNGMPSLVAKYIEENKAIAYRYDLKAIHKEVYKKLEDCHTVADIKEAFGNSEKSFLDLKELKDIKNGNSCEQQLFYQIAQAQLQGKKILDTQDDIVTYITKQIFLECQEYSDTIESLKNLLTPDGENLLSLFPQDSDSVRGRFFIPLGLKVPNGTTYGAALRRGAGKLSPSQELANLVLQGDCLSDDKRKLYKEKIGLMDAWNNSPEIRKDLSYFMFHNLQSPAYTIKNEDFTDLATITNVYTDDFVKHRMSMLMEDFWENNPQYMTAFGDRIHDAMNRFDKMEAIGGEEYKNYIEDVVKKSAIERQKIMALSANYKDPYATAKITLSSWLDKAKPLRLNTQETNKKIINLLFLRGALSTAEIEALQKDSQDSLFVKLTKAKKGEGGLIDKVASLSNDTTYRRILNAQSFSIIEEVLKDSQMTFELEEAFKSGAKMNEYTKKLIKGKLNEPPKAFNLNFIIKSCDKNEKLLKVSDQIDIAKYLFETYDFLGMEDIPKVRKVLSVQGRFLNAMLGENELLKELSETIFWSEYERSTNSSVLPLVENVKQNSKLQKQKNECIDAIDWNEVINSAWQIK